MEPKFKIVAAFEASDEEAVEENVMQVMTEILDAFADWIGAVV